MSRGAGRTQGCHVCPREPGPHRGGGQGWAGGPVRVGGEGLHGPGGGQQLMPTAGNPEEATPRSCPDGRGKPGTNTAGGRAAETQDRKPPSAPATFWKPVRKLLLGPTICFTGNSIITCGLVPGCCEACHRAKGLYFGNSPQKPTAVAFQQRDIIWKSLPAEVKL